jgi:DinB superfamily
MMNYTALSLADVKNALEVTARDAHLTFGRLTARQLNWRPDEKRWSVGQCFDHLITANRLIFERADEALDNTRPRTLWQRLPILPRVFGRLLIQSQAPSGTRKFTAPPAARPATSGVPADVVTRFLQQQHESAERIRAIDERSAAAAIMTSPFVDFITYSVLDGLRLVVAHGHRHIEQARRVAQSSGFPDS